MNGLWVPLLKLLLILHHHHHHHHTRQETGDAALRARALERHCLALTGALEALVGEGESEADAGVHKAVASLRAALDQPQQSHQSQQRGQEATTAVDEAVATLTKRVEAWAGVGGKGKGKGKGEAAQQQEQPQEEGDAAAAEDEQKG
jgi:hypothetical protein